MERFGVYRRGPNSAEGRILEEREQLSIYGDMLHAFSDLGKPLMGPLSRRLLNGQQLHISTPNMMENTQVGVISRGFSVERGTVFSQEGFPTAVASGYFDGDINPSLVGGVHTWDFLKYTGLNPRSQRSFPYLIRSLPGCHIDPEGNLVFVVSKLRGEDTLGLMFGDDRSDTIRAFKISMEEFRSKDGRKDAVRKAAGLLSLAVLEKYGR